MMLGTATAKVSLDASDFISNATRVASASSQMEQAVTKSGGGLGDKILANAGNLTKFGLAMGGVGAGITGLFALGEKTAIGFGREMANVNSIAQLSQDQLDKVGNSVLNLSVATGKGPSDLAAGLYDIYSVGFEGADALNILNLSAKGANAGLTDTSTSAKVLTGTLNAFGASGSDAQHYMDVLFQTVNDGAVSFEELSHNLANTAPMASTLGVSIEELGAGYALMTKNGIPAAQTETQIAALMRAGVNPTSDMTKALNDYGYTSVSSLIQAKGFGGYLEFLNKASGGTAEGMSKLLGSSEAVNAALVLGKGDLKGYNAELKNMQGASQGAGATQRALDKQMQSTAFKLQKLGAAWQVVQIKMTAAFTKPLNFGIDGLTKLLEMVANLPPGVQAVISTIAGLAGILLTAGGAGLIAAVKIAEFGKTIRELTGATSAVKGIGQMLSAPFTKLASAMKLVTVEEGAMSAGPLLPWIAAAAVAAGAFYLAYKTNFLGIGDLTDNVVGKIKKFGAGFAAGFSDAHKNMNFLSAGLMGLSRGIVTAFGGKDGMVGGFLATLSNGLYDAAGFVQTFGNYVAHAFKFGTQFKELDKFGFVMRAFAASVGIPIAAVGKLVQAFRTGGWTGLAKELPNTIGHFGDAFQAFNVGISRAIESLGNRFTFLKGVTVPLAHAFDEVGKAGNAFYHAIGDVLKGDLSGAVGQLKSGVDLLSKGFLDFGRAGISAATSVGKALLDSFKNVDWAGVASSVISTLGAALSGAGSALSGIWDWLTSSLSSALSSMSVALGQGIQLAWDMITAINWSDYIGTLAWDAFVTAIEWATYIGGRIADFGAWLGGKIGSLPWGTYLSGVFDFATGVVKAIGSLPWGTYLRGVFDFAADVAKAIGSLPWGTYLRGVFDFGADVVKAIGSLPWGTYLRGVFDFATGVVTAIGSLPWGTYLRGIFDFASGVVSAIGSLPWGTYLRGIFDFGTQVVSAIGNLPWGTYLRGVFDFGTQVVSAIGNLPWGTYLRGVFDFGTQVAGAIGSLPWATYLKGAFDFYVDMWTVIGTLPWGTYLKGAFDFSVDVVKAIGSLPWASYLKGAFDFSVDVIKAIGSLPWGSYLKGTFDFSVDVIKAIGSLPWGSYLKNSFDFAVEVSKKISDLPWNQFIAGKLADLGSLIEKHIPDIPWASFIPKFTWPSFSMPTTDQILQFMFGSQKKDNAPPGLEKTDGAPTGGGDTRKFGDFSSLTGGAIGKALTGIATQAAAVAIALAPVAVSLGAIAAQTAPIMAFGTAAGAAFTGVANAAISGLTPVPGIITGVANAAIGVAVPAFGAILGSATTNFGGIPPITAANFGEMLGSVTANSAAADAVASAETAAMAANVGSNAVSMATSAIAGAEEMRAGVEAAAIGTASTVAIQTAIAAATAEANANRMASAGREGGMSYALGIELGMSLAVAAAQSGASQVASALSAQDLSGAGFSTGASFSSGVAAGILSNLGAIQSAAAQVVSAAAAAAAATAMIHSPSKLFFREIGEPITLGVAGGMTSRKSLLAIQGAGSAVINSARGLFAPAVTPAVRAATGTGGRGHTSVVNANQIHNTFNLTQNPGEDGNAFANRVIEVLIESGKSIA